jgi:hypothetical protein
MGKLTLTKSYGIGLHTGAERGDQGSWLDPVDCKYKKWKIHWLAYKGDQVTYGNLYSTRCRTTEILSKQPNMDVVNIYTSNSSDPPETTTSSRVSLHNTFTYNQKEVFNSANINPNCSGNLYVQSHYDLGIVFYTNHITLKAVGAGGEETADYIY